MDYVVETEPAMDTAAEVLRVSFRIVKSVLEEEVLSMELQRPMTPLEVSTIWEKEWGVMFATRIKFESPPGHGSKWLNQRNDTVPAQPAVIKLSAPNGSVLHQLAVAALQNGATIDVWKHEDGRLQEEKQNRGQQEKNRDEDHTFSKRLQKMTELRKAQMSRIDQRHCEFQQKLEEDRRLEREQEEHQRKWEQEQDGHTARMRLLEEQRRKEHAESWEREQLRLLEEQERQEQHKERQEEERREQEEKDREQAEREEREDLARKLRLAEVERERKEREGTDPKFHDAMERRRARQEQNRLRQEARHGTSVRHEVVNIDRPVANRALPESLQQEEEDRRREEERLRTEAEARRREDLEHLAWDGQRPILAELITGHHPCNEEAWSRKAAADSEEIRLQPRPLIVEPTTEHKKSAVFAIPRRRA